MTRYSQSRGFLYTQPPAPDDDRTADEKESTRVDEESEEVEADDGLAVIEASANWADAIPGDD